MSTVALPIAVIGPMAAGKSTVSRALARSLNVAVVPLDGIRWYYYLKDGFSFAHELETRDFGAVSRHWEPYSISAVEKVLLEFPNGIIDFGAGHAHYDDPERITRLEKAMSPIANVVLIMPSANLDRAEEVCQARDRERLGPTWDPSRSEVNARFLRSECFKRIATQTVFVEGRPVEDVVHEILPRLE